MPRARFDILKMNYDSEIERTHAIQFIADRIAESDESIRVVKGRVRSYVIEHLGNRTQFRIGDLLDLVVRRGDWANKFSDLPGRLRNPAQARSSAELGAITLTASASQVLTTIEQFRDALSNALIRLGAAEYERDQLRKEVERLKPFEDKSESFRLEQQRKAKLPRKV